MKWLLFWSLAFGLLGGPPVWAISDGVLGLTPEEKAVHDAATIQDSRRREDALREAIRAGLLSADAAVRDRVFSYLSAKSRWIDIRPYAAILVEFSKIDHWKSRGLGLIDEAELSHAPREERLVVYRRAILEGQSVLRRGDVITRATALSMAALDGVVELREFVLAFKAQALRGKPDQLLPAMELRAGAADREDAAQLAADRLAAVGDEEFRARMDQDSGFRSAVLEVATDACAANPFSGERNRGCGRLQEVARRQVALDRKQRELAKAISPGENEHLEGHAGNEWLDRLKERIP